MNINDIFQETIDACQYLVNYQRREIMDCDSIFYLLKSVDQRCITQSDKIRFGIALEHLIRGLVTHSKYWNILPVKKGGHQKDIVIVNEMTKTIFYAEIKTNINLDTEKVRAMTLKIHDVIRQITTAYPSYNVTGKLMALRYLHKSDVSLNTKRKYTENLIVGVNEFLVTIGLETFATYSDYSKALVSILNKMAK